MRLFFFVLFMISQISFAKSVDELPSTPLQECEKGLRQNQLAHFESADIVWDITDPSILKFKLARFRMTLAMCSQDTCSPFLWTPSLVWQKGGSLPTQTFLFSKCEIGKALHKNPDQNVMIGMILYDMGLINARSKIGEASIKLSEIQSSQLVRVKMYDSNNKVIGFVQLATPFRL
jgi:hypothetical protein